MFDILSPVNCNMDSYARYDTDDEINEKLQRIIYEDEDTDEEYYGASKYRPPRPDHHILSDCNTVKSTTKSELEISESKEAEINEKLQRIIYEDEDTDEEYYGASKYRPPRPGNHILSDCNAVKSTTKSELEISESNEDEDTLWEGHVVSKSYVDNILTYIKSHYPQIFEGVKSRLRSLRKSYVRLRASLRI